MVTPHWLGVVRLEPPNPGLGAEYDPVARRFVTITENPTPQQQLQYALNYAFRDFKPPPPCSCNGLTQCKAYDGVNEMSACPDNPHIEGDSRPCHVT